MSIPEFVRISDSAHVFERDIDPLCITPSHSFRPDETLYARVVEADAPVFDPLTQRCLRTGVEYDNGAWQYKWTVEDLDEADVAANQAAKAASDREAAKAARAAAVEAITVTTQAGNTFDGDEISQARMSRAILVLSTGAAATVPWVLADNTVIQASAAELTEALALAGAEQARLWVLP